MISNRRTPLFFLFLATLALVAWVGCAAPQHSADDESGHEEGDDMHDMEDMEDMAGESAGPTAFFVAPADGATVGTDVTLEFGTENFVIEPVGEGMVHPGHGHFHIGLDTECLPAGVVIPTADPWVHFGDGTSTIDFSLSPGQHTLTLQVGDGEHRTLPDAGLCTTITVTAQEG